jgi:hypothetical protein
MSYYSQRPTRFDKRNDKPNPFNEKNWITAEPNAPPSNNPPSQLNTTPPHSNLTPRTQWIDQGDSPKPQRQQAETRMTVGDSALSKGVGNKSAVELMQDILKGVREGDMRAYYSK